jgi:hypothetical protein
MRGRSQLEGRVLSGYSESQSAPLILYTVLTADTLRVVLHFVPVTS